MNFYNKNKFFRVAAFYIFSHLFLIFIIFLAINDKVKANWQKQKIMNISLLHKKHFESGWMGAKRISLFVCSYFYVLIEMLGR